MREYNITFRCGDKSQDLTKTLEESIRKLKDSYLPAKLGDPIEAFRRNVKLVIGDESPVCTKTLYYAECTGKLTKTNGEYKLTIKVSDTVKEEDAKRILGTLSLVILQYIVGAREVKFEDKPLLPRDSLDEWLSKIL